MDRKRKMKVRLIRKESSKKQVHDHYHNHFEALSSTLKNHRLYDYSDCRLNDSLFF